MIEFAIDIKAEPMRRPNAYPSPKGVILVKKKEDIEYQNQIAYAACVALGCPTCEKCNGTGDGPRGGRRSCKGCKGVGMVAAVPMIPDGPIAVSLLFELVPVREKASPDLDNLTKNMLDAFNGVMWTDDRQVTHLTLEKRVADHGRITCRIERATVTIA